MTGPAEIADMVERIGRSNGSGDIPVNNAGIQHVAQMEEFPVERSDASCSV